MRILFGRFVPRREFVRQALFVVISGYAFHVGLEHYGMDDMEVLGVTELMSEHLLESK